ncbi:MAG TPA: hypothetical protein VM912_17560, partial [Terriglobales bacterium]|nr:hypothetical protein [Terriglobales bacterium]
MKKPASARSGVGGPEEARLSTARIVKAIGKKCCSALKFTLVVGSVLSSLGLAFGQTPPGHRSP